MKRFNRLYKTLQFIIMIENRKCPACGKGIQGRSDKKFCSVYCKNEYNNAKNRQQDETLRKVNHILKKNHYILKSLIRGKSRKISGKELREREFHFRFFTHDYTNNKGERYFYCYDFGYKPMENDLYLLVKSSVPVDTILHSN